MYRCTQMIRRRSRLWSVFSDRIITNIGHEWNECTYTYIHTITDLSWWRHQMETFSALLALCAGNSLVTGEFPSQRPVTQSFDVFFDLRLNKRLTKQSWGWGFGTPWCSLWHHRNVLFIFSIRATRGHLEISTKVSRVSVGYNDMIYHKKEYQATLSLIWINFNPSMDG